MNVPRYVKSKGKLGNLIPIVGNSTSQSFYPLIFLSKKIYDDLITESPSPKSIAHFIHEETHFTRQQKNPLSFHLKYFLDPKFRFNEELTADIEQMRILKKHSLKFDIDKRARALSGALYLWSVSFEEAKLELEKAWEKI